ncbi:putative transposase/invertase (TIGR01784 family) [Parabacteroides sp. PF5-6]|nr:putative transposase/invertase (TIGR01784 family) [Parabacteroides sp. PF5-6]
METLDRMPFEAQQAVFLKLFEVADLERMTHEERLVYDESLKNFRDYNNIIASAERISREEGREEGIAVGIKKGIQKGLLKGIKKGREEGIQKGIQKGLIEGTRQMAIKLKGEGFPLDLIHRLTGLSPEEIDRL